MANRDMGMEILAGIREIQNSRETLKTRELADSGRPKAPAHPQQIRAQLGLSQSAFAGLMGVSLRTVQEWEQGRREPSGPAKTLLRIAEQHPQVFLELA